MRRTLSYGLYRDKTARRRTGAAGARIAPRAGFKLQTPAMDAKTLRANALLMLTAMIWGTAFVAQRVGMESVPPIAYNGVRFFLGVFSLIPLMVWQARRGPAATAGPLLGPRASRRQAVWGTIMAGLLLSAGVSLQQLGLVYTTAGKAGFITGMYVVIVPFMGLVLGQRPGTGGVLGALAAVAGLYLLSVTEDFRIDPGDGLVLAGAFCWAAHVHVIGWLSPRMDCIRLACGQFLFCAVLSSAWALAAEDVTWAGIRAGAWPIAYGGVMSVGVAYTLQVVAQKDAKPTPAAIILSMEAVFAALAGWLYLGEILGARELTGCALMLAGMLVAQLWTGRPAS